jgi:hypothetical protein
MTTEFRHRVQRQASGSTPAATLGADAGLKAAAVHDAPKHVHPAGDVKHGLVMQFLRGASFAIFFISCSAV